MGIAQSAAIDSAVYNRDLSSLESEAAMNRLSVEREKLLNEQLKKQTKQQAQLATMASNYLGTWNAMLANSTGLFNTAAATVQGVLSDSKASMAQIDEQINAAVGESNAAISKYQQTYGGLESAAIDTAMTELSVSKELASQMRDLARVDTAGAATRAKADVGNEAAAARTKMADQLVALGVDPTSGTGRSMMHDSMDTEGINKVMAGNTARNAEMTRATNATAAGLNAINPSATAGIASGINTGERALMTDKNNLTLAGINARNQNIQTQGGLANSLTTVAKANADTASQAGEFGAALLGASMANRVA